jgi:hypothetical protein
MKEERDYYHDIDGQKVPDEENMIAFLLDECIVCITGFQENAGLCINVNDFFGPGSDAETFPYKDIPKLFDLYKEKGYDGVTEYVAQKRGIENISWRKKLKQYIGMTL